MKIRIPSYHMLTVTMQRRYGEAGNVNRNELHVVSFLGNVEFSVGQISIGPQPRTVALIFWGIVLATACLLRSMGRSHS